MSRQRKYTIKFPGGIDVNISIWKSTDSRTYFKQGKTVNGERRLLRTIRVVARDDASPTTVDDIEEIVPWAEIESMYQYRDGETGEEELIPIDKKAVLAMFKNSNIMQVQGVFNMTDLMPSLFDGHHYFLYPQREAKAKTVAPRDKEGYCLLYQGLRANQQFMLVKFIDSNREKFAVIYSTGTGMMMSILVHENYMREQKEIVAQMDIKDVSKVFNKLTKKLQEKKFRLERMIDECEEKIKEYIEEIKAGKSPKSVITVNSRPVSLEKSLFDIINDME